MSLSNFPLMSVRVGDVYQGRGGSDLLQFSSEAVSLLLRSEPSKFRIRFCRATTSSAENSEEFTDNFYRFLHRFLL